MASTTWTQVFNSNFTANDSDVDRTVWESPQWSPSNNPSFIGRTTLRNRADFRGSVGLVPVNAAGQAELRLSTWNPLSAAGTPVFLGAQISTKDTWGNGTESVKFEAKVKCPVMPKGAVCSLFAYKLLDQSDNHRDEIDFEFSSKHWGDTPPAVNTNLYVDSRGGGVADEVKSSPGIDYTDFNTFTLIWNPSTSVEWLINGTSIRTDTNPAHVPTHPMHLVLNFWAPSSAWGWAYDSDLAPHAPRLNGSIPPPPQYPLLAADAHPGQTWTYLVEQVSVSTGTSS